jgi:hypothetical protein
VELIQLVIIASVCVMWLLGVFDQFWCYPCYAFSGFGSFSIWIVQLVLCAVILWCEHNQNFYLIKNRVVLNAIVSSIGCLPCFRLGLSRSMRPPVFTAVGVLVFVVEVAGVAFFSVWQVFLAWFEFISRSEIMIALLHSPLARGIWSSWLDGVQ